MRPLLSILLLLLGLAAYGGSPRLTALDSVTEAVQSGTPEGMWRMGADGAVFSVVREPGRQGVYSLTLISSPDLSIPCGTPFGTMTATGKPFTYDASLSRSLSGKVRKLSRRSYRDFIVEYAPESGLLTFTAYHRGRTLNVVRLLPYLFRFSIKESDTRPRGIDAARRISPPSMQYPVQL
ncbi:MAG: hypothetical protein K2J38_04695 [Muribaculaceae bacterium]|nr:hypothetical protein [Muribaculaceae bacterium]